MAYSDSEMKGLSKKQAPKVKISNDKNELIGYLHEDKNGQELVLTRTNDEKIPCVSWEDDIKEKVISPDKQYTAVFYTRNCGATTDWATRVDLLSQQKDPNTIFVMKGDQPLTVQWKDSAHLVIQHPQNTKKNIYKQSVRHKDIVIEYHETQEPARESEYLEFSNFNYGLTGFVVWHSEELLFRMAGWAQEKSGLIKHDWGTWYANNPYGDDPEEQKYIKEGFEYYRLNRDEIEKGEKEAK